MNKEVNSHLSTIDRLLSSGNEKKIWKGAADLCNYVIDQPDLIWDRVVKYGSRNNGELQQAIALCVLEHVFQYHFKEYFPKAKKIVLSGNKRFRETFCQCGKFGQSEEKANSVKWDKLIYQTATLREKKKILYWEKRKKLKEKAKTGDPKAVRVYQKFLSA